MTRHDRFWRSLGAALLIGGPFTELLVPGDAQGLRGVLTILLFCASLLGIVLLVQGKKAVVAWRIETGRHRKLPDLIRSRARERRMKRNP